ncbi:MAG TPA: CHASE2 domain-containing protein [Usitatibacter sp.]|nr:CHASE2 domain-containing protein [Usitatibacter sp.]
MERPRDGSEAVTGAFAVLVLAIAGFAFSFTPLAARLDASILDREWAVLRAVAPRPAPDDIVIVGVDEASVRAVPEPVGAWNEPLGEVLVRIASGEPRAIALTVPLPDRSLDGLRPGLDRALLVGLAAARRNGPFVAALTIDARTRTARPIFPPYLAAAGEQGLGIDLWPRDADGVTRRYSLAIPTQDGGYPTLDGRLCALLSGKCNDGLIDFALGAPFRYIPFGEVLALRDAGRVRALFHDRIVLIGDAQRYADRIAVPFNLASWEPGGRDTPGIVAHAQALRTALLGAAPGEAARPFSMALVVAAALLLRVRRRGWLAAAAALGALALLAAAVFALRSGAFVPVAPALATLAAALAARIALDAVARRKDRFSD